MAPNTAYDSLIIGNTIELWGPSGGVPSVNPMCPGAIFRLAPGWDLSAPQPTTDFVASLITDGERPFGSRASDRTITLPILIIAPDFRTLAGASELLLQTIDNSWGFTLTWTRASTAQLSGSDPQSYPLILDCFRAQPSKIDWGGPEGFRLHPMRKITVTFQAMPYGRSDTQQQISFAAPIAAYNAPAGPPSPVLLDAFSTISSPQVQQSTQCVVGPRSCYWDPSRAPYSQDDGQNCPLIYSAALPATVNLTGMTSLGMWLGFGSRYYFNVHPRGQQLFILAFTLTDISGHTLKWSDKSVRLPVSQDPQSPAWNQVHIRIPQNNGTFNYAAVAAYSLTITNRAPTYDRPQGELRWIVAYIDNLTAYPSSQTTAVPSPRGSLYTLYGVAGTHRAPVSMQFQQAPIPGTPVSSSVAGNGTYTVPAGAVYLKVEAIGGGGAGGQQSAAGQAGGGGGAEYAAEYTFPVTPGQLIPFSIGNGGSDGSAPVLASGSVFGPAPGGTLIVTANPGVNAVPGSSAGGQGGSGSTNSVRYPGGAGRTASGGFGGGGGGSGGSTGAGNIPVGTGTVLFTSGSSTWLCPAGVTQVLVECWGAGGGGGNSAISDNGGGGGGGEYAAQLIAVVPGNSYPYSVGAGGAGNAGTSTGIGAPGGSSTFTGSTITVTANGGGGGCSDDYPPYAGKGGTGSTNSVRYPGGDGGPDDPYRGGGGSSAGPSAAGNPGSSPYGAVAPAGGGNGGSSGQSSGNGTAGSAPGGGGGGVDNASWTGGAGAAGQVRLTYPGGAGAPTNAGAVAVPGGGAGGAGGISAGTAGAAGSAPGGGGGGGNSSGTTMAGGAGGAGKLIVTPYSSPAFRTLIVHRPSSSCPRLLNPFVPVGGGVTAPGTTEFPIFSPIAPVPLNQNSVFTSSVTPWTAINSATLSQTSVWQTSGTALFTGNGSTANPGMASEATIPVTPADTYTASVNCYSPQGFATTQIIISWYQGNSAFISSVSSSSTSVPAGYLFGTAIQVTGTAPSNAAYAQVTVQMTGTPANTVQMYANIALLATTPLPADFGGTYTVILTNYSWNSPAVARTISVTVRQYEYPGGTHYDSTTTPITITPSTQVTNGIVYAGNLTLPLKATEPDNTQGYYTVIVTDSNGSDIFYDCLFLDTQGQSVIVNEPVTGFINYYVDEPDACMDLGAVLGSQYGRPSAVSVLDAATISGGPLTLEPGTSILLAYCQEGAPSIALSYYAHWFSERLE